MLPFYILCSGFILSETGQNSVAEGKALSDVQVLWGGHSAYSYGSPKVWLSCCSRATPARAESVPRVLLGP